MPCQDIEEKMNASDENPPSSPVKATGNGGAGRVDQETKNDSDLEHSDDEREHRKKRKMELQGGI